MGSLALTSTRLYRGVAFIEDRNELLREIVTVLNRTLLGKLNCTGTLTLTANAATTTLSDARIGANSVVLLMPTTANGAAALGGIYFTAFAKGSCTVNHANNAQTDKSFTYAILG